jgi:hypothetical protein
MWLRENRWLRDANKGREIPWRSRFHHLCNLGMACDTRLCFCKLLHARCTVFLKKEIERYFL